MLRFFIDSILLWIKKDFDKKNWIPKLRCSKIGKHCPLRMEEVKITSDVVYCLLEEAIRRDLWVRWRLEV